MNQQPEQRPTPERESLPRKSASPLLWIIVLLLLAALVWLDYTFFVRAGHASHFPVPAPFHAVNQHAAPANAAAA